MSKKIKCYVDGCERDAYYKQSGLCTTCYAFMHYWVNRSVTDRVKHARKIEAWDKRANMLLMPTNVSTITKRKKA